MAEGGVMGAIGALTNAVNDAIAPFGVTATRQPLTPMYLRDLLRRLNNLIWRADTIDKTNKEYAQCGFIGLGIMGHSMAGHLLAAGHPLSVYNRSRDKAAARWRRARLVRYARAT